MPASGEDRLVRWLARQPQTAGLIGNDTAVLPAGGPWCLTVDSQRSGIHFPPGLDPSTVAKRLLAVNLSDLAATGARPRYALLALAGPAGFDARRFLRALLTECRRYDLVLAGGDLSRASALEGCLTLLGERWPRGRFLSRSRARPGDRLWVGGSLGESALGRRLVEPDTDPLVRELPPRLATPARRARRRHLVPRPQLELGAWLARRRSAVAAIDLSDGLAIDLRRLCDASGVGAVVDAEVLPRPSRFEELCRHLEVEPLSTLLGGGEDYVLLFSLPPSLEPPPRFGAIAIGELTAPRRLWLREGGRRRPLPRLGWDHLSV